MVVNKNMSILGIAALWGLDTMVMIYTVGHVFGAHLNSAVTIAFASLGRSYDFTYRFHRFSDVGRRLKVYSDANRRLKVHSDADHRLKAHGPQTGDNASSVPVAASLRKSRISLSLWHKRLGHVPLPTLKGLNCFKNVSSDITNEHCTVSPLVKQSILSFVLSSTTSSGCFELLHGDVWGPYRVPTFDGKRIPSSVLHGKTPYELLYKTLSTLDHLRVFGCLAYATQDFVTQPKTSSYLYPVSNYVSYDSLSPAFAAALASYSAIVKPKTFQEAALDPYWVEAMQAEISALDANNTWSIVDLPYDKHPIGCKWVYKVKYLASGAVERYKACLVAKGFSQQEGLDYSKIFSPVAKMVTVWSVLDIAAAHHWTIEQMDVHNAFLHGELFKKQAPRQWNLKLTAALVQLGFSQSHYDYSLFTKKTKHDLVIVLVYVDDLLVTGSNMELIIRTKNNLKLKFKMKDLGDLNFFFGIEFARSKDRIVMSQRKYALELISEMGLSGDKLDQTPLDPSTRLTSIEYDTCVDTSSNNSCDKPLVNIGKYHRLGDMPHTKRSITGYLVKYGDVVGSWNSKKQDTIARSSAEANFRSMTSVVAELTSLCGLYKELGVELTLPIDLYCDSVTPRILNLGRYMNYLSTIAETESEPENVGDKLIQGMIKTHHISTREKETDVLTKCLGKGQQIPPAVALIPQIDLRKSSHKDKGKQPMNYPSPTPSEPMQFIIWNTRGDNSANFKRQRNNLIKSHNHTMIALLETKMVDHKNITEYLRFDAYLESSEVARKQSIVFLWKENLLHLQHCSTSSQGDANTHGPTKGIETGGALSRKG
ncbi:putative ras-related protein RABA4d-like [Capsicum annuum]|nr:putative ras-related protein RABA4d-like [Capsicum annuum]